MNSFSGTYCPKLLATTKSCPSEQGAREKKPFPVHLIGVLQRPGMDCRTGVLGDGQGTRNESKAR